MGKNFQYSSSEYYNEVMIIVTSCSPLSVLFLLYVSFIEVVIDHVLISFRALATEDFKVPDKMVGFSK